MNPLLAFFAILFVAALTGVVSVDWKEVLFGFAIIVTLALVTDDSGKD